MADERFGPTRRGGPVFRWLGERPAIDLANTVMVVRDGDEVDLLATTADLTQWLDRERLRFPAVGADERTLEELHDLRDAVRSLLIHASGGRAATPSALNRINELARAAPIARELEQGPGNALESRTVQCVEDPLRQLLGTVALDAIDLVSGSERDRLHVCDAPSCGMLFVGRRRWCCSACGNRARVARHHQRSRASARR